MVNILAENLQERPKGHFVTSEEWNAVVRALRNNTQLGQGSFSGDFTAMQARRKVRARVVHIQTTEIIPPFSIFSGTNESPSIFDEPMLLKARKIGIDEPGPHGLLLTNGQLQINPNTQGVAKIINYGDVVRLTFTGTTPSIGHFVGPEIDGFSVTTDEEYGLVVVGIVDGTKIEVVRSHEPVAIVGKVTTQISAFSESPDTLGFGVIKIDYRETTSDLLQEGKDPGTQSTPWLHTVFNLGGVINVGEIVRCVYVMGIGLVVDQSVNIAIVSTSAPGLQATLPNISREAALSTGGYGTVNELTVTPIKFASFTALAYQFVRVDSSGGPFPILLTEFPTDKDKICIKDVGGSLVTNNVTIERNGTASIADQDDDALMTSPKMETCLIYDADTDNWAVQASLSGLSNTWGIRSQQVLHFKCEDDAGTDVVIDSSQAGDNGEANHFTDTVSTASGKIDKGFIYTGSFESINCPATFNNSLTGTIKGAKMGWFQKDDITVNDFMMAGADLSALESIQFGTTASGKVFAAGNSIILGASWIVTTNVIVLSNDVFFHLALTHDGIIPRLFIDGIFVPQTLTGSDKTIWYSKTIGIDSFRVSGIQFNGAGGPVQEWGGIFDDIRVMNDFVTEIEILGIVNGGAGTHNNFGIL